MEKPKQSSKNGTFSNKNSFNNLSPVESKQSPACFSS